MQIKTIGTSLLISVIVLHVTVRIMAKDAYVISTADYSSTKEVTLLLSIMYLQISLILRCINRHSAGISGPSKTLFPTDQ